MQNIEREKFINMREFLPGDYASILFRHYQRKKMQFSRSLIYKVANGMRNNVIILGDLIEMATQNRKMLERLNKFEKRLGKFKVGRRQNGN